MIVPLEGLALVIWWASTKLENSFIPAKLSITQAQLLKFKLEPH